MVIYRASVNVRVIFICIFRVRGVFMSNVTFDVIAQYLISVHVNAYVLVMHNVRVV